jgi:hypothetical protein
LLNLSLSADQTLVIESLGVTLRGVEPVLNGTHLEDSVREVIRSNRDHIELCYTSATLSGGALVLKAYRPDAQGHTWIQYWVEGLPQELVLDSFFLKYKHSHGTTQLFACTAWYQGFSLSLQLGKWRYR